MFTDIKTQLIASDVEMYYHDGTRFVVYLRDIGGNPLVNQSVMISANGVDYNRTTDENGKASIALKLDSGKYDVDIVYVSQLKHYLSANATSNYAKEGNGYAKITFIDEEKIEELRNNLEKTYKVKTMPINPGDYLNNDNSLEYDYTGDKQVFTAPVTGIYTLETWGAQGGSVNNNAYAGGKGAYASGKIELTKGDKLYIYVGEHYDNYKNEMSFNGGGKGNYSSNGDQNGNGGGATDIRLVPTSTTTAWNEFASLKSRFLG